ncbi:MAG: hypothetical protein MUF01_04375, partial [Bryobacterales bacterium]|nr:hypothetical protein [Bryobacterales bacterium]
MTGYAVATRELPQGVFTLEFRAVNNRFLDLQFRVPEEVRAFEQPMREMVAARVGRGKVEGRVSINAAAGGGTQGTLDRTALQALLELAVAVRT